MRIMTEDGHIDREALLLLFMASLMGAVGILAFGAKCLQIDLETLGAIHIAGIIAGLTGGIFGAFLLAGIWQQKR